MVIRGTPDSEILPGTPGDDIFAMWQGGDDTATGDTGKDLFRLRAALTAADRIDGGGDHDTVWLRGDYSTGLVFDADTIASVETLRLAGDFSYDLTMNDGNVAAGARLTVNAKFLGAVDPDFAGRGHHIGGAFVNPAHLVFDGSAELDGHFTIFGSAQDDDVTGGAQSDIFTLKKGGNDIAHGGGGNDTFTLGAALTASDRIDGGAASDTLTLNGDYAGGNAVVFGATTMTNVENIVLTAGHSYDLTTNDATAVYAGDYLYVNASALGSGDQLIFNGSAETDVPFWFTGGAGNDVLSGGAEGDRFDLSLGGNDTAYGGDNGVYTEAFVFGAAFTAADTIDGGAGLDEVLLEGDYTGANAVVFGATTMTNIEVLVAEAVVADQSYDLTTNDATVAAGQSLAVSAFSFFGFTATLTFDGSAETDGKFDLIGDDGDDDLTGGAGNDQFFVGAGDDTAYGGSGGNDSFYLDGFLTASDTLDGGAGLTDNLSLDGDYTGANALVFGATTMVNVEGIGLGGGHSYDLTTDNATVASGQQLYVVGFILAATDSLTFDGAAETDGTFRIDGGLGDDTAIGGAGNDKFVLGGGADTSTGGGGADAFTYFSASESTSTTHDTITDFNANADKFDLVAFVGGFDGTINWSVDSADFDNDIGNAFSDGLTLHANHAWVVHASGGTLAGHDYLVVDTNSDANYDAGTDYVFDITNYTGTLDGTDFT